MATFKISKFSSLSFYHDWRTPFEIEQCYIQKFATTDSIRVQYAESSSNLTIQFKNLTTDEVTAIIPSEIGNYEQEGIGYTVSEVLLSNLSVGSYSFEFYRYNDLVDKSVFCIQDIKDLEKTILITYTNREDDYDAIFHEGEDSYKVFEWRIEGFFMPSEATFFVDNEYFRDQRSVNKQLRANPYKKETLTIGDGFGVPI